MDLIKSLFRSKKFVAMITGIVLSILAKLGIGIPEDVIAEIITLVSVYIAGQGLSDIGKEKAKIEKD